MITNELYWEGGTRAKKNFKTVASRVTSRTRRVLRHQNVGISVPESTLGDGECFKKGPFLGGIQGES